MRIRSPRDFWAGLLFIAVAAVFITVASGYRLGSAQRMGPAYFPIAVGSVLATLGFLISARSFLRAGPGLDKPALRALTITLLAVILFGLALAHLGLVAAIVILVLVGAFADPSTRLLETILLAAFLATFSVVVFVRLLGLPLQVWPDWTVLGLG